MKQDVFAGEDRVLCKTSPCCPGEHHHQGWLPVLPALELGPVVGALQLCVVVTCVCKPGLE